MELNVAHLYPGLMNLYGSYANITALRRLFAAMGHTLRVVEVDPGEDLPDLKDLSFLYMGAGTERSRLAALKALRPYGASLTAALKDGLPALFAGTAMDLLGREIVTADGVKEPALGLADFVSTEGRRRIVEDVYGKCPLIDAPVVGFINKCTTITGVEKPLLESLTLGFGNEKALGAEGYCEYNVFASQLTGPLFMKNPRLTELAARRMAERAGLTLPDSLPTDSWTEQSYAVTEEQLRLRA